VVYLLEEAEELRYLVAAEERPSLQEEGEVGWAGVESDQVEGVEEIPQSQWPLFHPSCARAEAEMTASENKYGAPVESRISTEDDIARRAVT
jgi:hypothetical protein